MVDQINGLGPQWNKATERQVSESAQLLKPLALVGFVATEAKVTSHHVPLTQFRNVGFPENAQYKLCLQLSHTVSHIMSGLASVLLQCIIHAKNLISTASTSKRLQSGIYLEGFAKRKVSVFCLYNWGLSLLLINAWHRAEGSFSVCRLIFKPSVFLAFPEALQDEGCVHLTELLGLSLQELISKSK